MPDRSDDWSTCRGCKGTGKVQVPRQFMSMQTGKVSTMMALARCPHCRETPGRQRGYGPPA